MEHCLSALLQLHLHSQPPGFNRLCEDNCKTRRETFKLWDLVQLGNLDRSVVCILICAGSPRNIQGNLDSTVVSIFICAGAFRNIQVNLDRSMVCILICAGALKNIQVNLDRSVVCILISAGSPRNIQGNLDRSVVYILIISPVSEGSGDVMVLRRSRPPPAMVLTR